MRGYRKVVEQTYEHRLAIIEANEDPAAIEAEIGSGQLARAWRRRRTSSPALDGGVEAVGV